MSGRAPLLLLQLRCVASRPGPVPVDTLRYLISDGPAGQAKLKVGPVLSPGMRQRNPVRRPRCRMRNQNDDGPQTKTAGTGTNTDKFAVVHVKSPFFLILEDLPRQGPIARPAVIWARYDVSRKEQGRGLAGAQERHGGVPVANGPCGDRDQHSMGRCWTVLSVLRCRDFARRWMFEASQREDRVAMLRPDVGQKQKPHAIISCRGGGSGAAAATLTLPQAHAHSHCMKVRWGLSQRGETTVDRIREQGGATRTQS